MSTLTGLIGGGGGGGGIDNALLPAFPENLAAANSSYVQNFPHAADNSANSKLPGHNSNGDYYQWDNRSGVTTAHSLQYYNNAGSLQWTINETNINPAADRIVSIFKSGSTIYLLAATTGTTAAWIATANESGTVLTSQSVTMPANIDESAADVMLAKPTGSSNVILAIVGRWLVEINPSTGAIVNESSSTNIRPADVQYPSFITPDNRCLSMANGTTLGGIFNFLTIAASSTNVRPASYLYELPDSYFNLVISPYANATKFMEWGNFIICIGIETAGVTGYRFTPRALYNKADFETWAESFMDAVGATLTAW